MKRPDGGMYGIKLILPAHLALPYFTEPFDGTNGRWPLMNFSREGRGPRIAENIPNGHRALVYLTEFQRFIWAIEFIGSVAEGETAAKAHGIAPGSHEQWTLYRPIRFLARIRDEDRAPTPDDIFRLTGIVFRANSFTHKYLSASDFHQIYDAIEWDEEYTD
jgi:hypothetical protein